MRSDPQPAVVRQGGEFNVEFATDWCPMTKEVVEVSEVKAQVDQLVKLYTEIRDLLVEKKTIKEWYTTEEVGELVGRDMLTVRDWCRPGRVHAVKQASGRGKHEAWAISHAELLRIEREGLLPDPRTRPAVA